MTEKKGYEVIKTFTCNEAKYPEVIKTFTCNEGNYPEVIKSYPGKEPKVLKTHTNNGKTVELLEFVKPSRTFWRVVCSTDTANNGSSFREYDDACNAYALLYWTINL